MPDSITVDTSRRLVKISLLACVAVVGVAACSDGGDPADADEFCSEVDANLKALTKPRLTSADDVDALIDLYRTIGELAPLAIESEWDSLTELYVTASTVDVSDADSRERVSEQAFRTERSAVEVKNWVKRNCGVDMPVTTIVDHEVKVPLSVPPTTTLPG